MTRASSSTGIPAAAAVTGLTQSAVLGMPADDVLPDWRAVGPTVPVASAPGPGSTDARTLPFVIGGREIWLSISGVAFEDGVVYAFRNLTEERALDELKGEFVATVSHELRTPLAAIYGSAQTLLRDDLGIDDEKRQRLLKVIAQESKRLARVAADILLANRIDSGRLQLETRPLDVTRLAEDVVEQMRTCFADRDERHARARRDGAGLVRRRRRGQAPAGLDQPGRQRRQVLAGRGSGRSASRAERSDPPHLGARRGPGHPDTARSSGSSASSTGSTRSSRAASAARGSASTSAVSSSAGWTGG